VRRPIDLAAALASTWKPMLPRNLTLGGVGSWPGACTDPGRVRTRGCESGSPPSARPKRLGHHVGAARDGRTGDARARVLGLGGPTATCRLAGQRLPLGQAPAALSAAGISVADAVCVPGSRKRSAGWRSATRAAGRPAQPRTRAFQATGGSACSSCLLIDTGARKSELLERRWKDIDLERLRDHSAKSTKTGVPRVLHFQAQTQELIRRVYPKRSEDALVFEGRAPGLPVSFRKAWLSAVTDAGVPGLHMHDVRHAAAARLLRAGVTLGVAAQVLGHSPQVLARRYGHLEVAALRKAQELAWRDSP
jgi:hypothetical protein